MGALHTGDGKLVLGLAAELVLSCAVFTKGAHGAPCFVGVFQAVKHHVVEHLPVAHAVTTTPLEQQIGCIGHALHAARHHHILAAHLQHVVRPHGSLHARAAHFGQSNGPRTLGQAPLEGRLAGWRLALAGHQTIAHEHFVH